MQEAEGLKECTSTHQSGFRAGAERNGYQSRFVSPSSWHLGKLNIQVEVSPLLSKRSK